MLPIIKNNSFGSAAVFIFRRFLRIGIPYYFAIFLSLIAIHFWLGEIDGSHWANTSLPVTTDDLLRHIFFIHQMFEDSANKINPAHWSVGVEFVIYMFFPLLYSISQKFGIVKTTLAVGLITYGLWFICFTYKILNPGFNGTSIYYLLLFMLGASSAYIGRHKEVYSSIFLKILIGHPNASKYVCYFVFFFTASFGIISARYNIFFPLQIQSLLIGFSVAVLLFLFNEKMDTSKGCVYNFFKMMGVIGFSIYLLHDPVVAITWKYIISPMNIASYWMQAVAVACLGLLLSISISGLFFIMIENPMHRLSKIVSY
jgi:peptidoglycan/LPS O-acetylase OafA/YrhL